MKNIGIVTSTRAEYGLLLPLIRELRKHENDELRVSLIVTGTHLFEKHGMTVAEIEASGERIDERIQVSIATDTPVDISKTQSEVLLKFTELFYDRLYDAICILGDRYEMQMVAIAACNTKTPIFHLCGGDTTEGAIDESIRHSITKMSFLHFVTNADSEHRVIQLGENPKRVYNVGSTSIDNILGMPLMGREEALESVGLSECEYAICTYHPVTLEAQDIEKDVMEFINAIEGNPDTEYIVTKANADMGGDQVNDILDREAKRVNNLHVFTSLGVKRYLSLMKYAKYVMGNSSSGIIETPAFHITTINIGDRQKGRLQSDSIINCGTTSGEICEAIKQAESVEMINRSKNAKCPYGDGHAAERMTDVILTTLKQPIDLKKQFYNLEIQ